jgi:DNA-binding LacI/PurR family transcriptional regulator
MRCCSSSWPSAGAASALGAYERLAASGRMDGFLITDPELEDPRFPLLEPVGLPVVVAGRPDSDSPFPWLETEHDRGAVAAVEHLVGLGHERIAFLGGSPTYEHVQRPLARWREALSVAGLDPGPVAFADGDLGAAVPGSWRAARLLSSARATRWRWRSWPPREREARRYLKTCP